MSERKTTFKDVRISAANRQLIIDDLKEEGFSKEELDGMLWEKVWQLYIDSVRERFSREMNSLYRILDENPHIANVLAPFTSQLVRELRKTVEDLERKEKESRREKRS